MDELLTQELLTFIKRSDGRINSVKLTEQCFARNNKLHLWQYLHNATSQFTIPLTLSDRIFLLENRIGIEQHCKICHTKPRMIVAYTPPKRYSEYCSKECAAKESTNKVEGCKSRDELSASQKRKQTMIAKYGAATNLQREDIKETLRKPKVDLETYLKLNDPSWMNNEYVVQDKTSVQIANDLNVNYTTVTDYLNKHGIDIRHIRSTSAGECEIRDYIKSYGVEVEQSKKGLIAKELDLYIPHKNVAIEYNGLYWHSELYRSREDHFEKYKMCLDAGIKLYQIWESEWEYKPDVVMRLLDNIIGVVPKIGAREGMCVILAPEIAWNFLDTYHILGANKASTIFIGLMVKDRLSAVLSVKRPSKGKTSWDLNRFSTNGIIGAFPKMIKYFLEKTPECKEIHSFLDLRFGWEKNNIYINNGFKEEYRLPPDYSIFYNKDLHHKFGFRKEDLIKMGAIGKTEHEMALSIRALRVYDAGKIKYRLSRAS